MTLNELFIVARATADPHRVYTQIMSEHGGLGASYQRSYGKHLQPYEAQGYIWEALPIAIIEWDATKGKACTVLGKVVRRLIERDRKAQLCVGSVRVPHCGLANYSKESMNDYAEGIISLRYYADNLVDEADDTELQ